MYISKLVWPLLDRKIMLFLWLGMKHWPLNILTYRRRFVLAKQKMTMTGKKFCLFMFFGAFATHLVYLGELTQIKYTAVRNKSIHYSQWLDQYLHHDANKSEIFRNQTKIVSAYYYKAGNQPEINKKETIISPTKVLLITSNPRSGSSYTGKP